MNNVISEKYKLTLKDIETTSLKNEQFKIAFNFERIKKTKRISNRLDKYGKNIYSQKKKQLREPLKFAH